MKVEEAIPALLVILLLVYVILMNPDVFQVTLVGYRLDFRLEQKPYFVWSNRWLDVVVQAFLLFTTAIAISALFRKEKAKVEEEEVVVEEEK
ncbi:MAG: hypothetical protein DRJ37_00030 [Thermoprotei archaeon]|nr:MAG: hypothetical protein DRJ38_05695 [Thermoprotei archaeon]RLE73474.1 MAG: hypothetical protein DRJ37_00030 [Thermoprotei archaeon]